jgi:putative endopeptidase
MKKYLRFLPLLLLISCNQENKTASVIPDQIDLSARDTSVRPQDNFFLYANGDWLKKTEIPAEYSSWGIFTIVYDTTLSHLRFLLDSLSGVKDKVQNTPAQQCADLYISGMDSAGIDKKGYQPVKSELDGIAAISNTKQLTEEIAKEWISNHGPFFGYSVSADERNSAFYIAHFYQGGLGLPNRDYYFNQDSSVKKIRTAYEHLIFKYFTLTGSDSASAVQHASAVMKVETALAKISKTPAALRDPVANYHKLPLKSLDKVMPGMVSLLDLMMIHEDSVIVGQPAFYKGLGQILGQSKLPDLKSYLQFHVLFDDAPYLSDSFATANFEYTKVLSGRKKQNERWKRMTELVDAQLGDALGQLYVEKYFPPAAKQRMGELVDNLLSTYAERIQQLDWMSDSTKQKALIKLHAIIKKIGYPDKWKDYSSIKIVPDDIIQNLRNTANYNYKRDLNRLGKPVDKTEWFETPPTIDAYYDPTQNNNNFPAGILQPPMFNVNTDDAVNYGAIGLVIGHEITHGFDDQGRQFDAQGNLKDWWSKEDAVKFKQRVQHLIQQYNGYVAVDTFHVNGELTQGENLADNGGLAIAYAAFKKTHEGNTDTLINGLTPDQRFFYSAAQVWRLKRRPENLRSQVLNDPHSAPMFRVNGPMSNMPAFYKAFNVQPADKMYRADSVRVKVW